MLINCDIGEQGPLHEGDRALMEFIHIANIACDGHAGDKESVAAFRALAEQRGVRIAAHLSYPDKPNFGRASMEISDEDLLAALDAQLALLPGVKLVKFHGALYNRACRDASLAGLLAALPVIQDWIVHQYIYHVPLAILATGLEIVAVTTLGIGVVLDVTVHHQRLEYERHILNYAG